MSLVVIFPQGAVGEAAADVYLAWCNINQPDTTASMWYLPDRFDKFGQRVVGYLGPGGFLWNSIPFPEPVGGVAARATGVLNANVQWPDEV